MYMLLYALFSSKGGTGLLHCWFSPLINSLDDQYSKLVTKFFSFEYSNLLRILKIGCSSLFGIIRDI